MEPASAMKALRGPLFGSNEFKGVSQLRAVEGQFLALAQSNSAVLSIFGPNPGDVQHVLPNLPAKPSHVQKSEYDQAISDARKYSAGKVEGFNLLFAHASEGFRIRISQVQGFEQALVHQDPFWMWDTIKNLILVGNGTAQGAYQTAKREFNQFKGRLGQEPTQLVANFYDAKEHVNLLSKLVGLPPIAEAEAVWTFTAATRHMSVAWSIMAMALKEPTSLGDCCKAFISCMATQAEVQSETQTAPAQLVAAATTVPSSGRPVCHHWAALGICPRGTKCRYEHRAASEEERAKAQQWVMARTQKGGRQDRQDKKSKQGGDEAGGPGKS